MINFSLFCKLFNWFLVRKAFFLSWILFLIVFNWFMILYNIFWSLFCRFVFIFSFNCTILKKWFRLIFAGIFFLGINSVFRIISAGIFYCYRIICIGIFSCYRIIFDGILYSQGIFSYYGIFFTGIISCDRTISTTSLEFFRTPPWKWTTEKYD